MLTLLDTHSKEVFPQAPSPTMTSFRRICVCVWDVEGNSDRQMSDRDRWRGPAQLPRTHRLGSHSQARLTVSREVAGRVPCRTTRDDGDTLSH